MSSTKQRIMDGILLAIILIGGGLAWHSGREHAVLRAEYARLTHKTGDLRIGDPTQVHFLALETGDPLHFAWRVYLPPNYQEIIGDPHGLSTGWSSQAREYIARVRFRDERPNAMLMYTQFVNGSGSFTVRDEESARLLREHRDKIDVEQFGAPDQATLGPQASAVLLRLTIPPELYESVGVKTRRSPVLYELEIGPAPAPTSPP